MVVGKSIEARPMMYVALTYDHRLIDGREVGGGGGWGSGVPPSLQAASCARGPVPLGGASRSTPPSPNLDAPPLPPHARRPPQAVTFLKRIKEVVEDPRRLLLNV
jgi:hypothetical protein